MEPIHSVDQTQTPEITASDYPRLAGETIIKRVYHEPGIYPEHPSSIEQLLRLSGSKHVYEIGNAGPCIASLSMPEETHRNATENSEYRHLYETFFLRDGFYSAGFLISLYPHLTRTTLIAAAKLQGTTTHTAREEEPGRMPHEAREPDELRAQELTNERGWGWPYYGAADTTSEYIRLLARYTRLNTNNHSFLNESIIDRDGHEKTMLDSLDAAIGWIEGRRAQNPEGLVEYKSAIPGGIENQAWKDSWDAYHHSDGTIANHNQGVASVEIQVSAYDALMDAAELYSDIVGNERRATDLRIQATELRDAIFNYFWTEDKGGYFVIGTDRDDSGTLRQLDIRTSNMGHVLNSRLLEGNNPEIIRKRNAVVNQLMTPEMLCDAGIRTLASDEIRFRPGAYHNGSVWPWDTYYIAKGLKRHGYIAFAKDLGERILNVVETTRIFPEYARGEQEGISLNQEEIVLWDETAGKENKIEQPPQEVHTWTVSSVREFKDWSWKDTPYLTAA